jgi:hypothetical protein
MYLPEMQSSKMLSIQYYKLGLPFSSGCAVLQNVRLEGNWKVFDLMLSSF